MKLKGSKKKLTISLALFIGALAVFATAMYFFISTLLNKSGTSNIYAVCVPLIICYFALMIASVILNMSYRKNSIAVGASSTVLYVFQFILLAPFIIIGAIGFIYLLRHGGVGQGEEQLKK